MGDAVAPYKTQTNMPTYLSGRKLKIWTKQDAPETTYIIIKRSDVADRKV